MSNYLIAALYHFVALPDFRELRVKLDELCRARNIKGTLLLAEEGINGTIAGVEAHNELACPGRDEIFAEHMLRVAEEARPEDAPPHPPAAPSPEARWKFCIALARWRCLRSLAERCVCSGDGAGRAAADACRLFAECVEAAARDVKCGEVLLRGLPGVEAPLLALLEAPDAPPRARVAAAAALAAACRAGAAPDRGAPGLALEAPKTTGGIDAARTAFLASASPVIARRAARALIECESPLLRVHLATTLAACVAAAPTAALGEIPRGAWRDVADRFVAGRDGDVFLRIAFKLLAAALVAGHAPTDRTLVVDCDVGARCAASPDDPFRLALCDVLRLRCASLPRDAPLRRLLAASAPWRAAQKTIRAAARAENARQPRGPPQLAAPRVDGLFGLLDPGAPAPVGGFDGDDVDTLLDERVDLGAPRLRRRRAVRAPGEGAATLDSEIAPWPFCVFIFLPACHGGQRGNEVWYSGVGRRGLFKL